MLHYALPLTPRSRDDVREVDEVIPCLCAWDRSLFPDAPGPGPFRTVPIWVCEIDEDETDAKLALHARAGVRRTWLVNPVTRSVSAFALGPGGRFQEIAAHKPMDPTAPRRLIDKSFGGLASCRSDQVDGTRAPAPVERDHAAGGVGGSGRAPRRWL